MNQRQEQHYKDRRPEDTVEFIQSILEKLGICTEELSVPDSSIQTHSLRVRICGTNLGSNGKGVNRPYARASAYAEFMERLQNDIFTVFAKYPKKEKGYYQFPDEKFLSSREVAELDNSFMDYFFKCRKMEDASVEEKAEYIRKNRRIDYFLNGSRDSYEARPFYSVRSKKVEYLPYYLYLPYYSSNGMSAGNTPEEALVQGFSEIIERHVQERIFLEKPALPDIPDTYIQKFPYIWERVEKLRKLPGLKIFMKDCSFGGRFPVAGLVIVDTNTGMYGVKLGCHPDYGVAMERTITEAAQGGDFSDYARRSMLDFTDRNVDSNWNIYNSYKFGQAPWPFEILCSKSSWEFVPVKDVSGMTNGEILQELICGFVNGGYDVLIRNVSYTGFPSFHIIVPGISEIFRDHSLMLEKIMNTKIYLMSYLNYPETFTERTVKLLKASLDYWSDSQIENGMKSHYGAYPDFAFPGEEIGFGWLYMSIMCCMYLGQYEEASERCSSMVRMADYLQSENLGYYRSLHHYCVARGQNMGHDEVIAYLQNFFSEDICCRLDEYFQNKEDIFVRQYPRFDFQGRSGKTDDSECEYNIWLSVKDRMCRFMEEHPIDQNEIGKIVFPS